MATIGEMLVRVGLDTQQFNTNMQTLSKSITDLAGNLTTAGATLSAALTAPIAAFSAIAVSSAANLQALGTGLTQVSSSAGFAAVKMADLKEVAKLPGLGFEEAIQGQIRLQGAGISANVATDALKGFGSAIAAVGGGKAELDGVTTALAQMAAKGKISAEEINQLAERMPQIREVMRAVYGTGEAEELRKMGVTPDRFIREMGLALIELYPPAETAKNAISNMKDAIAAAASSIGTALLPYVQMAIPHIVALAEKVEALGKHFQTLPDWQQNVILGVTAFAAAIGPLLLGLGTLMTSVTALAPALGSLGTAIGGVSAAAAGATAAIVALGAVIAIPGLVALKEEWDALNESVGGISGAIGIAWQAIQEFVLVPLASLLGMTGDTSAQLENLVGWIGDVGTTMAEWAGEILKFGTPFGALALGLSRINDEATKLKALLGPTGDELKAVNTEIANGARAMADQAMQTMGVTDETGKLKESYLKAKEEARKHRLEEEARERALKNAKVETMKYTTSTKELGLEFKVIVADAKAYNKEIEDSEKKYIAAALASQKYGGDISDLADDAEKLNQQILAQNTGIANLAEVTLPKGITATVDMAGKTGDLNSALTTLGITSATEYAKIAADAMAAYQSVAGSGLASDWEENTALLKALKAQAAAAIANGQTIPEEMAKTIAALEKEVSDPNSGLPKVKGAFEGFGNEVSTIITNTVQDMAAALFDGDLSWGEKVKSMLSSLGQAFVSKLAEPAIDALTGENGLVKKGLDIVIDKLQSIADFIIGLFTGGSSGAGALGSALGTAGSAIGSLFSGGGTQQAINNMALPAGGNLLSLGIPGIGQAASGAASAAGAGANAAAGVAGQAVSAGLSATLGAVFGGVQAVTGVIGLFQAARQEGTMNAIEENTRYVKGYIGDGTIPWTNTWSSNKTFEFISYLLDDVRGADGIRDVSRQMRDTLGYILSKIEMEGGMLAQLAKIESNTFWSLGKFENWDRFLEYNLTSMETSLRGLISGQLAIQTNVYLDSRQIAQALGDQQSLQSAAA